MDEIMQVASRIKELRIISGFSKEQMAQKLELSQVEYDAFEEGKVDIPASYLFKIAHVLNVELTVLLTGEEPRLHRYSVVRKGKGKGVNRREQYKYMSLAYKYKNKKAEPFLVEVPPTPENSPIEYNSHPGQEYNYVIEGRMKVFINGYEIILNEGDSLYFDSGADHAMKALDNKPCKFLAIITE